MQHQDFVIRPLNANDLDWLLDVTKLTGPGFTSLPPDKTFITKRVNDVVKSFKESVPPEQRIYLFVRENLPSGEIAGICGIQAHVGHKNIFYNYQICSVVQSCPELNITLDHKILNLANNFQTASELISFWVHPKFRGQRISKSLSLSRFMFIAQRPNWFGDEIISEIRGVTDDAGVSPFWESLGRHFFAMDFARADYLTMTSDKKFIADLVSHEPIYMDLLSEAAIKVAGIEHAKSTVARKILESEGMRYNNYIDIFDGGPLLNARTEQIRTIKNSKLAKVAKCTTDVSAGFSALIYNTKVEVRMTVGLILAAEEIVILSEQTAKILQVSVGDYVRYVSLAKE